MIHASKLPNYLRTFRKRFGFTLVEIGLFLGGASAPQCSRYERSKQLPNLKTAIAYEVIFGVPIRRLFAGLYEQVEHHVQGRAKELANKIARQPQSDRTIAKLEHLKRVIDFGAVPPQKK